MSLILFPRSAGPANVVRRKPRFQLLDEVRLPGERHARAIVTGTRSPSPWSHEVLCQRDDGTVAWLNENAVRPARFDLVVVDGGRS